MASFHELDRTEKAERSYPIYVRNNTPVWIAGVVIVLAALTGAFTYNSGYWGAHPSAMTTPTPPISATPPPDSTKP